MADPSLFAMGCGVSFIALAGAYAFLRERFLEGTRREAQRIERERDDG
ncbi:MAG: hypothetical protein HKP30_00485 [Myxococcales bacterium]|nr:hypothetical protein [Myxococcales bacterium]